MQYKTRSLKPSLEIAIRPRILAKGPPRRPRFSPLSPHGVARDPLQLKSYICARCLQTTAIKNQTSSEPTTTPTASSSPSAQKQPSAYDLFPATFPNGPPPHSPFSVDAAALRREFLQLQAQAHPDRHTEPTLKSRAEATSAALNTAYRTLLDPLLRARENLRTQANIDLENEEAAKEEDQELLMVVLEAREVIESAESEEDLESLREENEERIGSSERVLEDCLGRQDWERARVEAVRLRYWMNVRDAIQGWEKGKPTVLVH
ncbi:MAG: hypothetical protein Q9162_003100 [Coniocarpon cinnabarinum]